MARIAEQLGQITNATSVDICELDTKSRESTVIAEYYSPDAGEEEREPELGETYSETPLFVSRVEAGAPWIDRLGDSGIEEEYRQIMRHYGAKSILFVPLHMHEEVIGFAELRDSRHIRKFSQEEISLAQAIAQNAGIAIQNARLFGSLKSELAERRRAEENLRDLNERLEAQTTAFLQANKQLQQEIAERARIEASLRESEERYELAAKGATDGLWDWNLDTNEIYYSARWKTLLGYSVSEIKDKLHEWFGRIHPDDRQEFQLAINAHIKGITDHFEHEYRMTHRNGAYRWMLARGLAIRDAVGNAYRIAGSQTDITERKQTEEQLVYDAFHDALTGLPNRNLLQDRLEMVVEHAKRYPQSKYAVLFLDLDRFKYINDRFGHLIGDKLLLAFAQRLRYAIRSSDTVARFGGDEFVVLLEDISDVDHVSEVTTRIQENMARPFDIDRQEVRITCSIGIILIDDAYENGGEVLRDADIAMYSAKEKGRGQFIVFTPNMRSSVLERMRIETELVHAFEAREFTLHYQPIIALKEGRLTGFEALLRWNHAEIGMIPPITFIPIAEETRLIIPMGIWILREACQQLRKWQDRYPSTPSLTMSVNISSVQFEHPDFIRQVEGILDETGVSPSDLILEITERVIIDDDQKAGQIVTNLKDLGVRVHIDDFGTGYSALGYLQRFPIDHIKMDRSFVNKINGDDENVEIIKAVLNLARDLKIGVIAEGIETENQLRILQRLDCAFGQGYLLSRPVDSGAIEAMLELGPPSYRSLAQDESRDTEGAGDQASIEINTNSHTR